MKIFDEKRSSATLPEGKLHFYADVVEEHITSLGSDAAQKFIARMRALYNEAQAKYPKLLKSSQIDWKDSSHIQVTAAIAAAFQDFSFSQSRNSDLYQLVFYTFANRFVRAEAAQFLTPLPIIDFLVDIVNPRGLESVIDPCCGIADFLAVSHTHMQDASAVPLGGGNLYGLDIDDQMVTLATLNMLLNGDGESKIERVDGLGALEWKFAQSGSASLAQLDVKFHRNGSWDSWPDHTRLKKFDVVLTNPPFGEDRAFKPKGAAEEGVAMCYETWGLAANKSLDTGVMFLENTVRILKEGGRFGIVLSNSIASVNRWESVRRWLLERVRVVALFDLPPNVFGETGVNTTIIVGYVPAADALARLKEADYEIFIREIENVGYEKRTSQRITYFKNLYRINPDTFDVEVDAEGAPLLLEDFTQTVADFRDWMKGQERAVKTAFLGDNRADD